MWVQWKTQDVFEEDAVKGEYVDVMKVIKCVKAVVKIHREWWEKETSKVTVKKKEHIHWIIFWKQR